MTNEINITDAPHVVYQRGQSDGEKQPEFKPGNTPHTQFGDEVLNFNVPWNDIVAEVLTKDYSIAKLAEEAQTTTSHIRKLIDRDYSSLNFRTGARILGVHCTLFPEQFV